MLLFPCSSGSFRDQSQGQGAARLVVCEQRCNAIEFYLESADDRSAFEIICRSPLICGIVPDTI